MWTSASRGRVTGDRVKKDELVLGLSRWSPLLLAAAVVVNAGLAVLLDVGPGRSQHATLVETIGIITLVSVCIIAAGHMARKREAAQRESQARAAGALLVARTANDLVINRLSRTCAWTEQLAMDPRLPADLRVMAEKAQRGAIAAAEAVRQLETLARQEA